MMKKRHQIPILPLIVFIVLIFALSSNAQDFQKMFQQGLFYENGQGDLQEAINIYEEIIADETAENSMKAKAQLHIGICYEKLGKEEAIKAYELVVQNYQNYKEEVEVANLRLSELIVEPKDDDFRMINLFDKSYSVRKGNMVESASISPGGTMLAGMVFETGQNVAIQDLDTKEITLLTNYTWTENNDGWTYFPAWSFDGKELVYMYCDWVFDTMELQIVNLKGETRSLLKRKGKTHIIPRQWIENGSILIFVQDTTGFYTIGIVSVNDGSISLLHKTEWSGEFPEGDATISPEGKYIVFSDGPSNKQDLYIIDTKGGPASKITNFPMNENQALWSPDGKHIVFIKETKGESFLYSLKIEEGKVVGQPVLIKEGMQNATLQNWNENGICATIGLDIHDIHTISIDPESGYLVGNPEPLDYSPTGFNTTPSISRDGNQLAFFTYEYEPEVVVMDVDKGTTRKYPIDAPGFWILTAHCLSWLPDNSGLGFLVKNPEDEAVLYRLDIKSGEWESWPMPCQGYSRIEWGPDVNSVIYTDNGDEIAPGVNIYNLETKESKQIVTLVAEEDYYVFRHFSVSNDYKKLAFVLNDNKLMVYDIETGEGGIFLEKWWFPEFLPDGKRLFAGSKKGLAVFSEEGEELFSYDIRKFFPPGTSIWQYDWSPDNTRITFMTRNMIDEIYLMRNVLK